MIGFGLAALTAISFIALGIAGLLCPEHASAQYGLLLQSDSAIRLKRAMAVRDVAIGCLLGILAFAARDALAWAMCVTVAIAATDWILVSGAPSPTAAAQMGRAARLHGAGAAGLLLSAALLLAGY